jgi:probable HAF family extracellular repeat protein
MQDLGTLGGDNSRANGVNADGSVVVGWSDTGDNSAEHAFRWTVADNMQDLGTLGGTNSQAFSVNSDGSVVVGWSDVVNSTAVHAFRWTTADNMQDLDLGGTTSSWANGINADGTVVVGRAGVTGVINDDNFSGYAFRWTNTGGMSNLDPGGTTSSWANGVNAAGSVVVGRAGVTAPNTGYAFRWTETTGMQSVEDWIIANEGSPLAEGNTLTVANGVSADGNVVVGVGELNGKDQAFIARVTPEPVEPPPPSEETPPSTEETPSTPVVPPPPIAETPEPAPETPQPTSGIIGMADFQNSLLQPTVSGAVLHDRMRNAVTTDLQNNAPSQGQFALSAQGIYDKYSKDRADGDGSSGVFKLIYGATDWLRAGVGYIRAGERLDIDDNGSMKNDIDIFGGLLSYGDYKGDGLRGRLSFAYGNGDTDLTRQYLTASGSDQSSGTMDAEQYGYAMEIGYGFRVTPQTLITPMASYEWVRSNLDAYTETGGTFPAQFDDRTLDDSYARVGVKVKQTVSAVLDLDFDANYVVRLSSTDNPVSGSLIGLGTIGVFSQEVELSRDWFELRAGIDYVPDFISEDLHVKVGGQVDLGQEFDVPDYRIDTGLVVFF